MEHRSLTSAARLAPFVPLAVFVPLTTYAGLGLIGWAAAFGAALLVAIACQALVLVARRRPTLVSTGVLVFFAAGALAFALRLAPLMQVLDRLRATSLVLAIALTATYAAANASWSKRHAAARDALALALLALLAAALSQLGHGIVARGVLPVVGLLLAESVLRRRRAARESAAATAQHDEHAE